MKYEDIKDFSQRCEEHPDHQTGMISERMIQDRLSEEIDELRAYIETKQKQGEPVAWESLLGAIARGWCYEENANKIMDSELALAIAKEVSVLCGIKGEA